MNVRNYTKGMTYEAFVRRAHKLYDKNTRKGAASELFINLLDVEEGKRHSFLPSYQFEKVKVYLIKAFNAFIKNRKLSKEEIVQINNLKEKVKSSTSGHGIYLIIEEAIDATQSYKEF